MHTAQHLLSSVIDTSLKTPTLTWSLIPWPSPAYVDLPRSLTAAEIGQVQGHAAARTSRPSRPCSSSSSLPRPPLPPPPSGTTSSPARVCSTTSAACSRCSRGQQASSRAARRRHRNASPSPSRRASGGRNASTTSSGSVLGRQLADEMARWRAAGGEGEWASRCLNRTDDSPTARTFLQAVTLAFETHLPRQVDAARQFTLLLVSSPSSQTSSSTTVVVLFGGEEKRVKAVGEELKRQFRTLKGAGKDTRWSGKFVGVWLADRQGKTASALLSQTWTQL